MDRYEYAPGTGLQAQRRDGGEVDWAVPGYGPGTTERDAREYVAGMGGSLVVYAYPASQRKETS